MKILYLVHQFYPMHYTGTEKVVFNIASMMQKMGHKVKVMTYSYYEDSFYDCEEAGIISKEFLYQGIDVFAFRHRKIPAEIDLQLTDRTLAGVAEKMVSGEKPDIVHVGHPMRLAELVFASKRLGIPYMVTLTDFWLICPKFTLINSSGNLCAGPEGGKTCLKDCPELRDSAISGRLTEAQELMINASRIVAPSGFLAGVFRNEVPSADIEVINHGLRYGNLRKNNKRYGKGDTITFCYCGSLNEHKGVHIAIDAVAKIKSNRVRLKIYGSGNALYSSRIREMVAGDGRIEFCGVYTDEQAADVFASADAVIVPSVWYETYALVMREAFFCSMPVIASDAGVMAESIRDGVNGFTFRIGDPSHLRAVIEKILANPEILNTVKEGTANIYVPAVEQEACAYHRAYREVLSGTDTRAQCPSSSSPGRTGMKILLAIHEFFPESTGGAEVLVRDTGKMLQSRGHDVRVFTAYPSKAHIQDDERFDTYTHEGLTVERFNHSVVPMGGQTNIIELEYNNLFFAAHFREFLKKWRPDVVHFFHLHRLSASAIDVCAELGIPAVYTATDFWPVCVLSQLRQYDNSMCTGPDRNAVNCLRHLAMAFQPEEIRSKVRKMPDWLLALTVSGIRAGFGSRYGFSSYVKALAGRPDFMRKRLNMLGRILVPTHLMGNVLEQHGVEGSRVVFQQFGINLQYFEPANSNVRRGSAEKLRVGFIGALFEHKGAHLLIEAVRSLPADLPVEIRIYGNLKQSPDYSEKLKALAGEDLRTTFCGTFPNDQIGTVFAELDVLVVPSIWYENTPLVIYSAQAAGCPVIAADLGGMSEVVLDRVNGLLFEKGDVSGLAGAITLLANDRKLLAELERNTKRPKSIQEYVTELERHYKEVVSGRGGGI